MVVTHIGGGLAECKAGGANVPQNQHNALIPEGEATIRSGLATLACGAKHGGWRGVAAPRDVTERGPTCGASGRLFGLLAIEPVAHACEPVTPDGPGTLDHQSLCPVGWL